MKYLYRHRQLNDWIPHIWFISGTDGQWGKTPHPISIQAYGRMDSLPPEFLHGLQAQHTSTWPSHRFCLDSLHFVRPICGRIQAIPSGRCVGSLSCSHSHFFFKLSARESKQKKICWLPQLWSCRGRHSHSQRSILLPNRQKQDDPGSKDCLRRPVLVYSGHQECHWDGVEEQSLVPGLVN